MVSRHGLNLFGFIIRLVQGEPEIKMKILLLLVALASAIPRSKLPQLTKEQVVIDKLVCSLSLLLVNIIISRSNI